VPRTVADVMSAPIAVTEDLAVVAAARLMRDARVGALPVVEGGRLVGVLTDRDIVVRAVAEEADPQSLSVGDIASFASVRVRASDSLEHALQVMATHQLRHVAVVDADERIVGSVTQAGIARTAPDARNGLKRARVLPIS
jgi:CBS domain-containing protein